MTDLPARVAIHEEGPREGFQIEPGPISTADKVRFCEALAETGLHDVQCVSFVDARRVPGMADAVEVAQSIRQKPGVHYSAIALNLRGYERAIQTPLHITGGLQMSASNTFSIRNTNKDNAETLIEQRRQLEFFREHGIPVESAIVMTCFGCNFEGAVAPETVRDCVGSLLALADEFGIELDRVRLADNVGWASPAAIQRVVGVVHDRPSASACICTTLAAPDWPTHLWACRWGSTVSTVRVPASAAARSPGTRARRGISAPRTSYSCARKWVSRPASTWTR
jgi:hydroxymethylglutaryl-CoA lyase